MFTMNYPMSSTAAAMQQMIAAQNQYFSQMQQMMPNTGVYAPFYGNTPGYQPPQVYQPPTQITQPVQPQVPQESVQLNNSDWRNKELINGVKSGDINREEFVALATFRNDTAKIVGMMTADGNLCADDRAYIASRERQYDKLYQQYKYGNYYPNTARNDAQQQKQISLLGKTWVGLRYGDITRGEGNYLLNETQDISVRRGQYLADGTMTAAESRVINNGLNVHESNVNKAISNSVRDGYWGDNGGLW